MKRILADGKIRAFIFLIVSLPTLISGPKVLSDACAQPIPDPYFDLQRTVQEAISANLELKSAQEEIGASEARVKARQSEFFPIFNLTYQYKRNDDEQSSSGIGVVRPRNEYALSARLTQPVFKGFENVNLYKISEMGLKSDFLNKEVIRKDIVFSAKDAYFSLLKAKKLRAVAEETVAQIESQRKVAKDYYDVGLTPLNDLLQAEVELANAKQQLIISKNEMETAEAVFNTLLRRPINAPVELEDITTYQTFTYDIEYCFGKAEKNRGEIQIASLELQIAEKELKAAKKNYYPSIDFEYNYIQQGDEWDARGGLGVFGDGSVWNITTVASWDIFEWGRTYYRAEEQVRRVSQARLGQKQVLDDIRLQVKKAYLAMRDLEENIKTVELAVEQAKENFRIFTERYKQQIVTQTDVLIAQTLLSRTQTNYYRALYDYKRAKAALFRAMGFGSVEQSIQ